MGEDGFGLVRRGGGWEGVRAGLLSALVSAGMAAIAAAGALALVLLGVKVLGYPPGAVLAQWVKGATGAGVSAGKAYRLAASLKEACPLVLTGLAAAVAFRSGVLNIGAQGQYLIGALALTALATRYQVPGPAWVVITTSMLAGAIGGGLWAGVAALLERARGVPVVLSTILLNFVATGVVAAALQGPLQAKGSSAPQSERLADAVQLGMIHLPGLGLATEVLQRLHWGVALAFALAAVAWVVLEKTTFGFELLVSGLNPEAARLAGVPVLSRQFAILIFSGCFAGLAGAIQVIGVKHDLSSAASDYGYAGIAVALLGRLDPLGVAAAAVFFGMLQTGASYVEKNPDLAVPHDVADITKGIVVLSMLLGAGYLSARRARVRPGVRAA